MSGMVPGAQQAAPAVHKLVHATTVPETLRFLSGQLEFAARHGFHVEVLSSSGSELDIFAREHGVPSHGVTMQRRITPVADVAAVIRIWWRLRRIDPTIVHAHTPKAGLLTMIASWLAGVPVRIYHMHGLPMMTATGSKRRLLRWCETISCRLATEVLCVSESIRDVAIQARLCAANKITVLANGSINGVDASSHFNPAKLVPDTRSAVRQRYGIPDHALVVGFVGRIVRDKGLTELIEAWGILRAEFRDLHLLVVGPFEEQDPVPEFVRKVLVSDPHIRVVGVDWDTPPLYAAMDVFVLPSYREGFPVAPLEAAAMGLPVVATDIPGCIDAVTHGVTGTLVGVRDTASLTTALRAYLMDPALRSRHGAAGRERVLREFRQEDVWEALCDKYCVLLHERRPATAPAAV